MAEQQHLATADHWALVGRMRHHAEFSCLLELRDRIEALEAPQSGSIDLSHLSDAEREKILKLIANPGTFEVLEVAQPAKPNHPEFPDGSLLSRVAAVIDNGTACDRESERIARDTIREVAAWLRKQNYYGVWVWVKRLEREAER